MKATKFDRQFGKCRIADCKTRRVVEGSFLDGVLIHYGGHNEAALRAVGLWCGDHNTWLKFDNLKGTYNADKDCNGVCMAGVGPSCSCACGGENHGRNHL